MQAVVSAPKGMGLRRVLLVSVAVIAVGAGVSMVAVDRYFKRLHCQVSDGSVDALCLRRNELRASLGPAVYSQYDEELLVRDFFGDARGGFFVDVGAGHYRDMNMTLFLEEQRGWRGIAVDANPSFAQGYAEHRPGTKFFSYFVADKAEPARPFFLDDAVWALGSGDKNYLAEAGPKAGLHVHEIAIPSITLDALLEREGATKVDFLSMDIEQGEPAALAGFDINRWKVELACIEMQTAVAPVIVEYMQKHRYVAVKRNAELDKINTYFAPVGSPRLR
jgi:FkbM family methyltransferase